MPSWSRMGMSFRNGDRVWWEGRSARVASHHNFGEIKLMDGDECILRLGSGTFNVCFYYDMRNETWNPRADQIDMIRRNSSLNPNYIIR